ncbi:MAG: hypothetical protein FWB72_05665 [Firmicutes bacterium]|nr:hypothetical protein [Bacillota bacterium]
MKVRVSPETIGDYGQKLKAFAVEMQFECNSIYSKTLQANSSWNDSIFNNVLACVDKMKKSMDNFAMRSDELAQKLNAFRIKLERYLHG